MCVFKRNLRYLPNIYSCFDEGCPAQVQKRTRQCRLVLWVEIVWGSLSEVNSVLEGRRYEYNHVSVLFPSVTLNGLQLQSSNHKPPLPIIHFDIVAYAFMFV